MSEFGWHSESAVQAWLRAQPYSFDFFQAVKIVETLSRQLEPSGIKPSVEREPVRFRARGGLEFPPSDIREITPVLDGNPASPPEMAVTFMSLAGALGPLPSSDTERLIEQVRTKDLAFRDFLDLFHHRLLSLFYRVRKTHHVALTTESSEGTNVAHYLYSFIGLGLPSLRNRMAIQDRRFLHYAGLLGQRPRSAVGLQQMLSDHFPLPVDEKHRDQHRPLPVKVRQFTGNWLSIEPDQWTYIGRSGQNQRIGMGIVLGTRVWDQAARFEIQVGPMPISQFLDFLPTGTAFLPVCEMTRFYAGQEFDFTFRLTLQRTDIPPLRLGQSRLGWTSWIREQPFSRDDSQVRLNPQQSRRP